MIFKKRGRGRPPKGAKRRRFLFRAGFFLIGFSCLAGFLYWRGFVTRQGMVDLGRGVLGVVSSESNSRATDIEEQISKWGKVAWAKIKSSVGAQLSKNLGYGDEELFRFAVVADSHQDTTYFPQVLRKIEGEEVQFLIHLGDLTNDGDRSKLSEAKHFLERSGVEYYLVPGDHDHNWVPSRDLSSFQKVFGQTYTSFVFQNNYFILLDNSDRQGGLGQIQMEWVEENLIRARKEGADKILVFAHIPLYSERFPHKAMVSKNAEEEVREQGVKLLGLFADFEVDMVFFGDVHHFSQYFEPESNVQMVTVGAACGEDCKNFLPQYVLVRVYEDGRMEITPKPYKELEDIQ